MEDIKKRKYKEALPKDTINRIRGLLSKVGIVPIEKYWNNSVQEYYSIRLTIPNTSIGVNGKGTTYEYALASAYAELMERLQNMTQYRLSIDVSEEAHRHQGFYYCPDEKPSNIFDIIFSEEDWMKQQKKWLPKEKNIEGLLRKWQKVSYERIPYDFITMPYMNINTKRLSYIPIKMASKMYMSNGMCAGNIAEEAIVQGISEILERYINIIILKRKITPPTYPEEYLRKYPRIYSMIKNIEATGDKKIIIKDCSLGQGYPVTAVIYMDQKENAYFVKFGSHPVFEIAVERTLTELLQGQDISRMMGLTPFYYDDKKAETHDNLMKMLVNGNGVFPHEIFQNDSSYSWQPFREINAKGNKELLRYLMRFLELKGYHIYVRDVSFLGFPTFHVIIPGMSEIENFYDEGELDRYIEYNHVKRMLRKYSTLTNIDKRRFLNSLENNSYFFTEIPELLFLTIDRSVNIPFSNVAEFIILAYCDMGDYDKAYQACSRWTYIWGKKEYLDRMDFLKCTLNYLHMKKDNQKDEVIMELLGHFYSQDIIDHVMIQYGGTHKMTEDSSHFICWNCNSCRLKGYCNYKNNEKIYKILKESYIQNQISQDDLRYLI